MLEALSLIPAWYLPLTVFIFGVIIGSFLNVVICRWHTGKSLAGNSHCLSCGTRLRAIDLVPLLSYVALRGQCRTCGSYIPSRYFLVELITGLLFLTVALTVTDWIIGLLLLVVMSILVLITVYDLYHLIIPDELVIALSCLALILAGYELYLGSISLSILLFNLGAALLGSLFLYGLWAYSKGRWIGFGDVKLAFPLGLMVGYQSVFSFLTLAFWVGAIVGLGLLILGRLSRGQPGLRFVRRRLTMKSAVPFAPFMIVGFLLTLFFALDVLKWFSYD